MKTIAKPLCSIIKLLCLGLAISACSRSPSPAKSPTTAVSLNQQPVTSAPNITSDAQNTCKLSHNKDLFPPLPQNLPPPRKPERVRYFPTHKQLYGVGHLGLRNPSRPGLDLSWVNDVVIPLYNAPNEMFWGWIACGWLIQNGSSQPVITPLTAVGLETSYETHSFTVLETRPNGWFQFRFARPDTQRDGTAWTHSSYLALGRTRLKMETWEDNFKPQAHELEKDQGSLSFIQRDKPHVLRASPSNGSQVITQIRENHGFVPLEIQEGWMRVRVFQPSNYCSSPNEWKGTIHEGWIRWFDADQGLLVFYSPRGC